MINVVAFLKEIKNITVRHIKEAVSRLKTLQIDNMHMAYRLLDEGYLGEAKIRLKTIISLWRRNYEARYLLVLVYILDGKKDLAQKTLSEIPKYNKNFSRNERGFVSRAKLLFFIENGDFNELRKIYFEDFSILLVENYIEKFEK
ncbi:MAG: tetratricopeptide repeat protein [Rickettsiales bacterium]|jgi:thioredoxin-like negative regulator of GroEL|nr:tetratricopeptide repeat protein [Rickettsiales bacterium]